MAKKGQGTGVNSPNRGEFPQIWGSAAASAEKRHKPKPPKGSGNPVARTSGPFPQHSNRDTSKRLNPTSK